MTDFDVQRNPLDVLAEEFAERHRQGEHPSIEEYAAKHPELAGEIRALFPSVLMLERLTERKDEEATSGAGRPGLVPRLERLGDYHILREIGRGGMGVVYQARQESLGRRVALKVLVASSDNKKHRQRFEREARAAAQLHHTNIVPIFGVGREEGFSYYVMQYIDGENLGQVVSRLAADGPRRPDHDRWVAQIGLQVAEALDHAHSQGVIHRDIKPANLLLDPQGQVWITDFGVARLAEEEGLTAAGDLVGTLRYMAPEQFNGEVDPRSDLYSLGLTLYELLVLRPAFDQTSRARLIRQLTDGQVPRLRALRPDVPRDLETIIFKAIAREPKQRYATAAEMAEDLRRWLEDRPIRARRIGPVERLWRWGRRNRAIAALAVVALASLVGATAVGWLGYLRTKTALEDARSATRRAEANLDLSLQAFETIFNRVAGRDSVQPLDDDAEVEIVLPTVPSEHDLELLEQLLQFYERFAAGNQANQRLRAETARAYRRVGEIQQKLGRPQEADEAFQRALTIYRELATERGPSDDNTIETAAVYNGLGLSQQLAGQRSEARKAFEQALALLAHLDSDRSRLERIQTHNMLGRLLAMPGPGPGPRPGTGPGLGPGIGLGAGMGPGLGPGPDAGPGRRPPRHGPGSRRRPGDGRSGEAEAHHRQALTLAQTLIARDAKNPDYRLALARSYEYLALVQLPRAMGEALESNRRAIDLLKTLATEYPSVALYRQELAESYLLFGIPSRLLQPSDDTTSHVQEALRIAEALHAEYPQVPEYAILLARTISRHGSLLATGEKHTEALREYQRATELLQSLADRHATIPFYGYLSTMSRHTVGEQLRAAGRLAESRAEFEKAIAATEALVKRDPRSPPAARFFLARQYLGLAATLRQMGQSNLADEVTAKARALGGPPEHPTHGRRPPGGPRDASGME